MLVRQGDPRFGPAHNPLIPKTKLSKQGNHDENTNENEHVGLIKKDKDGSKETKTKFFSFEKVPSRFLQNMPSLQLELHKRRMDTRRI